MSDNEREQLLLFYRNKQTEDCESKNCQRATFNQKSINLSLFFATLCVIDLFGVFPIVALPEAIISCGEFISLLNSAVIQFMFFNFYRTLRYTVSYFCYNTPNLYSGCAWTLLDYR